MRRRRSFRTATAMIVAVGGAVLISVDPRAGAEPVDLELVNAAGGRPAWLWATLDATWFGPRTPAPGEWRWRGERRALACDAGGSTAEYTLADGEGFAPVLSDGVGTLPGGAGGGGGGGGGGGAITLLAFASCSSRLHGVGSAGSSIGGGADLGVSTGVGGWKSAPAALMTVQYSGALADALPTAEEAPVSASLVAAETNTPAVAETPLPTAALAGVTVLGGVGLLGRRRSSR